MQLKGLLVCITLLICQISLIWAGGEIEERISLSDEENYSIHFNNLDSDGDHLNYIHQIQVRLSLPDQHPENFSLYSNKNDFLLEIPWDTVYTDEGFQYDTNIESESSGKIISLSETNRDSGIFLLTIIEKPISTPGGVMSYDEYFSINFGKLSIPNTVNAYLSCLDENNSSILVTQEYHTRFDDYPEIVKFDYQYNQYSTDRLVNEKIRFDANCWDEKDNMKLIWNIEDAFPKISDISNNRVQTSIPLGYEYTETKEIAFSETGNYKVTLNAVDSFGQRSIASKAINIIDPPGSEKIRINKITRDIGWNKYTFDFSIQQELLNNALDIKIIHSNDIYFRDFMETPITELMNPVSSIAFALFLPLFGLSLKRKFNKKALVILMIFIISVASCQLFNNEKTDLTATTEPNSQPTPIPEMTPDPESFINFSKEITINSTDNKYFKIIVTDELGNKSSSKLSIVQ